MSELMSAIKAHAIQSPNNTNWKSIAGSSVPVVEKSAEDREFLVEALTQHFLFSGMDEEEMHVVVDSMSRHTFAPGTLLTQRGDASQCCYVLQQGSAEIVDAPAVAVRGAGAGAVPSSHVEPPGMVGELALLYDSKYETSVQATRECVAWSLHRHTFRLIVLSSAVKQFEDAKRFLRGVALLAPLDASQISRLAEASQRVSFMDGARIINQGDAGDIFYLIMRGRVRVMKRIPPVTVASAGSGKELRSAAGSTRSVTSLVASNAAGSARILATSSSAGKLGASSSAAAAGGSTHRVPSASALDGGALQTASDTSALSGDEAAQQARLLGSIPLSGAAMHAGESSRVAAHDGESKGVPARAATKKLQERNMVGDLLLPDVTPVDETYIDKPSIVLSPQTRKQFGRWSQISGVSDLAAGGVLREGSHDEDSEDEASHHSAHAAGENEEVELMQMEVGSWFGEQALLNDAPRAASVLADGPVTCLALTRDLFFLQLGSLAEVLRAQHTQREQIERSVVAMRSFHSPIAEVSETADSATAAASASSVSPRLGGDTPTASLPPLASARGMQRNLTFTERQMQIFLVPAPGARSETETGLSPVTSTELARSSSAARLAAAAAAAASAEPASVLTSPSITAPLPDSGRVASPRSSAFPVTSSTGIMSPTSARANTVQQGLGGPRVSTGT
ncbi:MAG: cyclic nucleotide-binding domain-containing protein, partial [Methanobacteriota archaeon]